jgi:cyclopropane fatty-acyl-phospholipid synthase-like methyltransferase
MDRRKQIVRDAYDRVAERYLDWSVNSEVRARYLETLLAFLPASGAEVLELGCGAGLPVTKALSERAQVTAVDISPEQVRRARENAPEAEVLCADMMALDFPDARFDAVVAFYAITHLPREEHAELFRRISRWLKPGGTFLATLGATGLDDHIAQDWLGAPNFFSHFDGWTSLVMLYEAGFDILRAEIVAQDLPGEDNVSFLWLTARKV